MAKKGQKQSLLASEFREEIIQRYAKGERNPARLSEEYGVSKKTIQNWIYKLEHPERFPGLGGKRGRPKDGEKHLLSGQYVYGTGHRKIHLL